MGISAVALVAGLGVGMAQKAGATGENLPLQAELQAWSDAQAAAAGEDGDDADRQSADAALARRAPAAPRTPERPLELRPGDDGRWVGRDAAGAWRPLTLDGALQTTAERFLREHRVPYGAIVAVEPATGRVLAMADSHDASLPAYADYGLDSEFLAASLSKVVTGAALTESGVSADERVCGHGGKRGLSEKQLRDDARRDWKCQSLSQAMAHSNNVVFGKLATRHLTADSLSAVASRLGFTPENAPYPADDVGLARAAAGFGGVRLTPLHAALLAATIANGGRMPAPTLWEGRPGLSDAPALVARGEVQALSASVAGQVRDMMTGTTVQGGTAWKAFRQRSVRRALAGVEVAGKTGNIFEREPAFRDISWFIGFAPADNPQIAVASLVVNDRSWRTRGHYGAAEVLRAFFDDRSKVAGRGGGSATAAASVGQGSARGRNAVR